MRLVHLHIPLLKGQLKLAESLIHQWSAAAAGRFARATGARALFALSTAALSTAAICAALAIRAVAHGLVGRAILAVARGQLGLSRSPSASAASAAATPTTFD